MNTTDGALNIDDHIVKRLRNDNPANEEALMHVIDTMASKITEVVFSAWGELFDAKGKEIRINSKFDRIKDKYYLDIKIKENNIQYQVSERSMGFKWFFTFLLFTEFRKNRSSERGEILFLLDEPASNLHSTAQKKLLKTFERLATNCRLIYTTHSHHLIHPDWLSSAYVIRNKALDYEDDFNYNSTNTDIDAILYKQFVVDHPSQHTYFQPILDALDYQPGNLEVVPSIVLTEGKNDYYTFRYVNDIILNGKYDINLYPGMSSSKSDQIIAMYIAWGRDFTILLDGDVAGKKGKARYLENFGLAVKDRIFTLEDIDALFIFPTEKLFSADELLNITKYHNPRATKFEKKSFNKALQTMLIEQYHFELEASTIAKFEKIFEFIK